MAADSGQIVDRMERLRKDFQALSAMVSGAEAATHTAASMERRIFRDVLALGRQLLEVFFITRAAVQPAAPLAASGLPMTECRRRPKTYRSVFGTIVFLRHRFFAPQEAGVSPLDADMSLPEHCYSLLLRDWAGFEVTDGAFEKGAETFERILGLDLSKSALETMLREDAADVDAFYDQKPAPPIAAEGSILVAQADGAGVRLVGTEPSERTGHRTSKREALVTAVYSIQPNIRSPEQLAEALLADPTARTKPSPQPARPAPVAKESRATLDGKDAAITRLADRVALRNGPHFQHRVALTDGAEALQNHMTTKLPHFTLVLDIMHVLTYLWPAAQALNGRWRSPACLAYLRQQLLALLAGDTQAVIDDLITKADAAKLKGHWRAPVDAAVRYFTRNAPYMRYDHYLAQGWPVATGVIEGACKHLVRDRMECSGMIWTQPGAHAMLQLRAVRINTDWDDYQSFHSHRQHQRLYHSPLPPASPENQILVKVA